nr:hypothetical protein [Siminovitchia acidinfaciens]
MAVFSVAAFVVAAFVVAAFVVAAFVVAVFSVAVFAVVVFSVAVFVVLAALAVLTVFGEGRSQKKKGLFYEKKCLCLVQGISFIVYHIGQPKVHKMIMAIRND